MIAGGFCVPVEYKASDDLISLVRSMFALRHPDFRRCLDGTPSEDLRESPGKRCNYGTLGWVRTADGQRGKPQRRLLSQGTMKG